MASMIECLNRDGTIAGTCRAADRGERHAVVEWTGDAATVGAHHSTSRAVRVLARARITISDVERKTRPPSTRLPLPGACRAPADRRLSVTQVESLRCGTRALCA